MAETTLFPSSELYLGVQYYPLRLYKRSQEVARLVESNVSCRKAKANIIGVRQDHKTNAPMDRHSTTCRTP